MKYNLTEDEIKYFKEVCKESDSMLQAAAKLNMHFNTFKRLAQQFDCYNPNKSGKGCKKNKPSISLEDIWAGKYPEFQTYKLKLKMLRAGVLEDKCEICGWNQKVESAEFSPCELHHKDGNRTNHARDNLILLCPNCHSLTETYRAKNKNNEHIVQK